jgi:hypothetical protein
MESSNAQQLPQSADDPIHPLSRGRAQRRCEVKAFTAHGAKQNLRGMSVKGPGQRGNGTWLRMMRSHDRCALVEFDTLAPNRGANYRGIDDNDPPTTSPVGGIFDLQLLLATDLDVGQGA